MIEDFEKLNPQLIFDKNSRQLRGTKLGCAFIDELTEKELKEMINIFEKLEPIVDPFSYGASGKSFRDDPTLHTENERFALAARMRLFIRRIKKICGIIEFEPGGVINKDGKIVTNIETQQSPEKPAPLNF